MEVTQIGNYVFGSSLEWAVALVLCQVIIACWLRV